MSSDSVLDVILRRRSTRYGFVAKPVPESIIRSIVRCGLAAPSSKGAAPWRFSVVQDRGLLDEIGAKVQAATGLDEFRPHDPRSGLPRPEWESTVLESAEVLRQAQAAVFVQNAGPFSSGRKALLDAHPDARQLALFGYELEIAGLGAAVQNMWLAAVAQGISAVFMGDVCVAEAEVQQLLGNDQDLLGVLALGYAVGASSPAEDRELDGHLVTWH